MQEDVLISKRNSLILKGGGILLMLIHHLFYMPESQLLYNDITIHGVGVVNQIGLFCKLCVAVFVFVSGYGLATSTPKDIKLKDYYWHRFKKLYLNYWFIWILFVPIGIFVFGRTLPDAYGEHVALRGVLDFLGLLKMFGVDSYNPAWWFYNCIIILYLVFPLLNRFYLRTSYLVISISLTIGLLGFVPIFNVISNYLFVFILGMLFSKMPVLWLRETRIWQILVAIIILSVWRFTAASPKHIVDGLLCAGLAMLIYKMPLQNIVGRVFEELGKHSMNMFLIHSFISWWWFRKYIYLTHNPLIILLSLLVTSYLLSVGIEWIKNKMFFYKLLK